ncbi:autoinducer binding domain-containing protein [Variovorax sp. KK3]|uniref:autoinducer binding domain-containing protein n=1 Tax=Variovorax sp. KK3 TaxID=1855728 RepID=UPI00097BDE1F|nr:autoinducer binding domain-containing protein [Variovorax sp. KK3]
MKNWQEELLSILSLPLDEQAIFDKIVVEARRLGFEYCSYGLRCTVPLVSPKVFMNFNYPSGWAERYRDAGYVAVDPTVLHGQRSTAPLIWTDSVFAETPDLWDEVRSFGVRVGWAQSSIDFGGSFGMLTLSRAQEKLDVSELTAKGERMQWLVSIAHASMTRALSSKIFDKQSLDLTSRETEVLKWTADGKTASEVADILSLTSHTVNFHVRHVLEKLDATNKTAAAVKAALLGLLN